MESYLRDAPQCLGFCKGFQGDVSGKLSLMIDLMAMHYEDGGIPAEPSTYIAGMLGLSSSRKWTQTIEPTLLKAGRIRKVTRNGIKVYVFPDDQMRGPKALFKPVETEQVPLSSLEAEMMAALSANGPGPAVIVNPEMPQQEPWPQDADFGEVSDAIDDAAGLSTVEPIAPTPPVIEDTTPATEMPSHSAYDVLKQAGIDVESHERGELFWMRTEHSEVLNRWLETVPLNEIVVRIDKARIAGNIPSSPNSLLAFDNIVLGVKP